MLNSSALLATSAAAGDGGGGASASNMVVVEVRNEAGSGGGEEEGDRNLAGNRWPREETEALLKIRSDMDQSFRDSILKAPLWDEVSRKLGELGYIRNGKKCKEKFENIYKYHKRTKDGRSSRRSGKNYRFFQQLEIFESQNFVPSTPLEHLHSYAMDTTTIATPTPPAFTKMAVKPRSSFHDFSMPCSIQDGDAEFTSASTYTASSSGKESQGNVKKKRKLADYFQSLMKEVLAKQEDLQKRFLEVIEKSERDRIGRDELWKVQEMARIRREQELLANERAMTAAKDAAVLSFLQNISQQNTFPMQMLETLAQLLDKPSERQGNVLQKQLDAQDNGIGETSVHTDKQVNSAGENTSQSSSRWPKAEVEALIMLKTDLDLKYQDNGGKGTVWEDISSCMKKLGYDRNAKRCKEKWENINKYYKRVKESNKKRPEYSKSCPYFTMLDSLYSKKFKRAEHESVQGGHNLKPEQILMQMMGQQQQSQPSMGEYADNEHNPDDYDEVEQGDDSGECYQIVANDPSSLLLE